MTGHCLRLFLKEIVLGKEGKRVRVSLSFRTGAPAPYSCIQDVVPYAISFEFLLSSVGGKMEKKIEKHFLCVDVFSYSNVFVYDHKMAHFF